MSLTRLTLLALALCLAGHIHAAPVVVRTPNLTCPETELGDEALQARYKAMWEKYSADENATTKKLQAELEKQEAAAIASGNLELVLFWQARAKEFGQNGELKWDDTALKKTWKQQFGNESFPASFTVAAKKASEGFQSAQQGLETSYDDLVKELTKAGNLPKALKLQAESDELLAVKATAEKPAQPEQGGRDAGLADVMRALQGEWVAVAEEENNSAFTKDEVEKHNRQLLIRGQHLTMERQKEKLARWEGKIQLDPKAGAFNWAGTNDQNQPVFWTGIYSLQEDTLKLCFRFTADASARPTRFSTSDWVPGTAMAFYTFKKKK